MTLICMCFLNFLCSALLPGNDVRAAPFSNIVIFRITEQPERRMTDLVHTLKTLDRRVRHAALASVFFTASRKLSVRPSKGN